ncbi:MAG: nucleotide-binding protein [Candidatus Zapsychrus exili]|nr:nucleotide-binding protein [Candidatus Zapsychrus exili]
MLKQVVSIFEKADVKIEAQDRLKNDTGHQLKLKNGAIVNIYDNGTLQIQGKNKPEIEALLKGESLLAEPSAKTSNEIFVVYGHDSTARTELEAMLRRWKLEPLFLDQLPSEGQTLIEKLEKYSGRVNYAVILATPDDEGHRVTRQDEKAFRARQNVVLELGMLLALLGRRKVAILLKEQENMERPSDMQGLIYIPFKDNLQQEVGPLLAKEMVSQGYSIDITRL